MRVVVFGATGNVGTSVLRALLRDKAVDQVVGVARRPPPDGLFPDVEWHAADVTADDLTPLVKGSDAVVHLAWALHPVRDLARLQAVNVGGTERILRACVEGRARALVYASSVGAYSPGPKDEPVDESHPTDGIASSSYSRHKAYVERLLDRFELEHEVIRVARLRPGLIFKGEAAHEVGQLFGGPLLARGRLPARLFSDGRLPLVPDVRGLAFQAAHTDDVAEAYRAAVVEPVSGAFNIAADPVLTPEVMARELAGGRRVPVPPGLVRLGAALTFALRIQPSEPGWFDMAMSCPVLDVGRARRELGWMPRHSSIDALREFLRGLAGGQHLGTPQLSEPRGAS